MKEKDSIVSFVSEVQEYGVEEKRANKLPLTSSRSLQVQHPSAPSPILTQLLSDPVCSSRTCSLNFMYAGWKDEHFSNFSSVPLPASRYPHRTGI